MAKDTSLYCIWHPVCRVVLCMEAKQMQNENRTQKDEIAAREARQDG